MDRWEYGLLSLNTDAVGASSSAWWMVLASSKEHLGPELPYEAIVHASNHPGESKYNEDRQAIIDAWERRFADLGAEGWELVSTQDNSSYFKRRIASSEVEP